MTQSGLVLLIARAGLFALLASLDFSCSIGALGHENGGASGVTSSGASSLGGATPVTGPSAGESGTGASPSGGSAGLGSGGSGSGGTGTGGTDQASGNNSGGSSTNDGGASVAVGGMAGAGDTLVQPIARPGGQYVLEFGDLYFAVDPKVGARIVGLQLSAGVNLLTGPAENADGYGSTFRLSPQSAWSATGWPPPPELDSQPYSMSIAGQTIVASSTLSTTLGASVTKRFTPLPAIQALTADYEIHAVGTGRSFAPWEVTRVFPGGLTFYPTGDQAPFTSGTFSIPATMTAAGCTWFKYPSSVSSSQRLISDGKEGWLAHVTADGVLLVKKFPDIAVSQQAPGEGEISIYVDGSGKFIELETQGAYRAYAANDSVRWAVTWYVRKLPPDIMAAVGNQALVDFVRGLIR